jgi:hypothetical protein
MVKMIQGHNEVFDALGETIRHLRCVAHKGDYGRMRQQTRRGLADGEDEKKQNHFAILSLLRVELRHGG